MSETYLTLEQAAARLKVSPQELLRRQKAGEVRGFAEHGVWRFTASDLDSAASPPSFSDGSDSDVRLVGTGGSSEFLLSPSLVETQVPVHVVGRSEGPQNRAANGDSSALLIGPATPASRTLESLLELSTPSGDTARHALPGNPNDSSGYLLGPGEAVADRTVEVPSAGSTSDHHRPQQDSSAFLVGPSARPSASVNDLLKMDEPSAGATARHPLPKLTPPPGQMDDLLNRAAERPGSTARHPLPENREASDLFLPTSPAAPGVDGLLDQAGTGMGETKRHALPSTAPSPEDEDVQLIEDRDQTVLEQPRPAKPSEDSDLSLISDSGISLVSDSGISLESSAIASSADSGISLVGSAIRSPQDSGISLDVSSDSGLSLSLSDAELRSAGPVNPHLPTEAEGSSTQLSSESLREATSEFEIEMLDSDDEVPLARDATLDDGDDEDGTDSSVEAAFEVDEDDEASVATDDLFDNEFEPAEEASGEFAPASRAVAAAPEDDWGTGTFAALVVGTVLLLVAVPVMLDVPAALWSGAPDSRHPVGRFLTEFLGSLFFG